MNISYGLQIRQNPTETKLSIFDFLSISDSITQILVSSKWHRFFLNSRLGDDFEVDCISYMDLTFGCCYETVMN